MKRFFSRTTCAALLLAIGATVVWAFPTNDPNTREVSLLKRLGKAEAQARPPDKGLIAREGAFKDGDLLLASATIDKLLAADLIEHKLQPNAKANNDQFLRRVYLDVVGRIPTLDETIAFRKAKSSDKREKLIDLLLASEGYAHNFFNFYADLLRIQSRQSNSGDVVTYPYLEFVKTSLKENTPYDKFVQKMITAEGYTWEDGAAGYWLRDLAMPLDGVSNTAQVFLGTRLVCAQCHDHPFDVWSQHEFYEMAAYTYGLNTRVRGNKYGAAEINKAKKAFDRDSDEYRALDRMVRPLYYGNTDTGRKISLPRDYKYKDAKPGSRVEPLTIFGDEAKVGQDSKERRAAFAKWLTSKDNPRFAKTMANRLWKRVMGMGLIEPVDDMKDDTKASNPELMAYLTKLFTSLDYDQKKFLKVLLSTQTYQRQVTREELVEAAPYYFQGPLLRRMSAEQFWDSLVTLMIPDPDLRKGSVGDSVRAELAKKLQAMSASELIAAAKVQASGDRMKMMKMMSPEMQKNMNDPRWKGYSSDLVRASELQSPMRGTHFLRLFGQSDREVIDNANIDPNVVQVLAMFNGRMFRRVTDKGTTLTTNITKFKSSGDQAKVIFLALLNRMPSAAEAKFASGQIKKYGYESFVWALLNTRQFSFVQ
jgi:hypothetical protein